MPGRSLAPRSTSLAIPASDGTMPGGDHPRAPGGTSTAEPTVLGAVAYVASRARSWWVLATAASAAVLTLTGISVYVAIGLATIAAAAVKSVRLALDAHRDEAATAARLNATRTAPHPAPPPRRAAVTAVIAYDLPRALPASPDTARASDILGASDVVNLRGVA